MTVGDDARAREEWAPEAVLVAMWRESEFLRLGFEPEAAQTLSLSDADLRRVEQLLDAGCSHELAERIAG